MNNRSFYFFAIALAALIFCTYAALLSPEALDAIASLLCGESGVAGVAAAGLASAWPSLWQAGWRWVGRLLRGCLPPRGPVC